MKTKKIDKMSVIKFNDILYEKSGYKCIYPVLDVKNKTYDQIHDNDVKRISSMIDDLPIKRVLDIGCGTGRLRPVFDSNKYFEQYIGIDFYAPYIEYCRHIFDNDHKSKFIKSDVCDIETAFKKETNKFDFFIINGLLMYLTDEEISKLFKYMQSISSYASIVYINEKISVLDKSIFVKKQQSNGLEFPCTAMYRTTEELENLIWDSFGDDNISLVYASDPLDEDENNINRLCFSIILNGKK